MIILKIIPETNPDLPNFTKNLSREYGSWYLHGELEKLCGYDIGYFYETPPEIKESLVWSTIIGNKTEITEFIPRQISYLHGIYPVEVYGVKENCIGYFWITNERDIIAKNTETNEERVFKKWIQRGLVCLESDHKGNKEALEKFRKRSEII